MQVRISITGGIRSRVNGFQANVSQVTLVSPVLSMSIWLQPPGKTSMVRTRTARVTEAILPCLRCADASVGGPLGLGHEDCGIIEAVGRGGEWFRLAAGGPRCECAVRGRRSSLVEYTAAVRVKPPRLTSRFGGAES